MITVSDFMAFRRELVEAEKAHPEWRKAASSAQSGRGGAVPAAPGAKTYWRLRNGTRGIARHLSNELDDLAGTLGYVRHISELGAGSHLTEEEARLVSKWMTEWEGLKERQEG